MTCSLDGYLQKAIATIVGSFLFACSPLRQPLPAPIVVEPNRFVELVSQGTTVYIRTSSMRVWCWDTQSGELHALQQGDFIALVPDGSVGMRRQKARQRGERLEVRELAKERLVAARTFENGVVGVPVMTRELALIELRRQWQGVTTNASVDLPPLWEFSRWDFDTDQLTSGYTLPLDCADIRVIARDGGTIACLTPRGARIVEFAGGQWRFSPPIAANWRAEASGQKASPLRAPRSPESYAVDELSLALTGDGHDVFIAYADGRLERRCRIERWTPDATGASNGSIERIVEGPWYCGLKLLAVSDDGSLIVTGGAGEVAVVRRAPQYSAEKLSVGSVALATVLVGGTRIATGHDDGRLRLWDARTLALVATVTLP